MCKRPGRNRAARGVGGVFECGLGLVAMRVAAGMATGYIAFWEAKWPGRLLLPGVKGMAASGKVCRDGYTKVGQK